MKGKDKMMNGALSSLSMRFTIEQVPNFLADQHGNRLAISRNGNLFISLFDDVHETERDVWSHPALVRNRLYVRNLLGVYCFVLH